MARITRFIGGQTVTDATGTGERNIIRSNNDALDITGFVAGNIYITRTEITNSVELTAFAIEGGTASVSPGGSSFGGSFQVRVTGNEGASYNIAGSDGAGNTSGIIPVGGFNLHTITISTNDSGSTRNPAVSLSIALSDPETVFADGFTPGVLSVSQISRAENNSCFVSPPAFSSNGGIFSVGGSPSWSFNVSIVTDGFDQGDTEINIQSPTTLRTFNSFGATSAGASSTGNRSLVYNWSGGTGTVEYANWSISTPATETIQGCSRSGCIGNCP